MARGISSSKFAVKAAHRGIAFIMVFALIGIFSSGIAHAAAPNSAISTNLSRNWSGYIADSSGDYTGVTGTWTVPSVTTSASVAADATWVGIGGVSSDDLIQAGTQAITQNGSTQYQAWYEVLPGSSNPVSLTVSPGDSVTATLSEQSSNLWLITIRDNTTGQSYSNTVNYASSNSSAEWIEEMPSDQVGLIPLDDFGSVSFDDATATVNGSTVTLVNSNPNAITMVAGGSSVLASPSPIGADGESFAVTRSTASSEVMPRAVHLYRGGFSRGGDGVQGFVDPSGYGFPAGFFQSGSTTFPYDGSGTMHIFRYSFTTGNMGNNSNQNEVQTFQVGPYTINVMFSQS